MSLYKEYLDVQGEFINYEDFYKNFRLKKPKGFNFAYDVVDRLAREKPNATALVYCDDNGREQTFTFRDISLLSNKAANAFASLGIKKGDRVMLILKRHWEFWGALMGLHKIGAVGVPATHLLTKKDVVYRVQSANVKLVVATAESAVIPAIDEAVAEMGRGTSLAIVRGEREGWVNFNKLVEESPDSYTPTEIACENDPILLYFTSGTTGYPKMVVHNHYYPLAHIVTASYWQQTKAGGLHLTISDTGWMKSIWGKLYGQWLAECAVFVYDFDKFVAANILSKIQKYKITTFCAPPTMYRFLLQEDFAKYDLSSLEHLSVAGEPLSPDMFEEVKKRTGLEMNEAFGQTELVVMLGAFPSVKPVPGSMGKPSPLFDVDLIDDDGNSVPVGVPGELVVRTHHGSPVGMMIGYENDPAGMAQSWHDGIYHTGDLAWKDEWGYYWYQARKDDIIKSSGYRIGPFEVESALAEHPAVLESAITGVPDEIRGMVVKATIHLKPGYTPSDELKRELQDHVKRVTAPYKYPRIIEFVDELPKTISGKIRRVELRERG
ncbi:MAG: AMP-binding protein [Oscillospiraceae bacterium]|nr:AMP-binding protein [Oscillospiraceae bacterium]